jgi:hypothetical protein
MRYGKPLEGEYAFIHNIDETFRELYTRAGKGEG